MNIGIAASIERLRDSFRKPDSRLVRFLQLAALSAFAFGQPLYDLYGRNPEFFIARQTAPLDLILLIAGLSLGVPLALFAAAALAGRIRPWAGKAAHGACAGFLSMLVALSLLKLVSKAPPAAIAAVAALSGGVFAACLSRYASARQFVLLLSPAALLFPALFLGRPGIAGIAWPFSSQPTYFEVEPNGAPVVLLVFDEINTATLLNGRGEIDETRFPNFGRLAREGTWFRNASTVFEDTNDSIASILTGQFPRQGLLPTSRDYPRNLFTLLGGEYDMRLFECSTSFRPELRFSAERLRIPAWRRLYSFAADSAIAWLHLTLPAEFAGWLPRITQGWSFTDLSIIDAPDYFRAFVESLEPSARPRLAFLHCVLPHVPYRFLPSGQRYRYSFHYRIPGLDQETEQWGSDEWLVDQAWQLYYLQAMFADRLLGELIDSLKKSGQYDETLLIATADHGVSFRPNRNRRWIADADPADILYVPLFVKGPGQRQVGPDDRNAEHIDILPTIADWLEIEVPWAVSGKSLRGEERGAARDGKIILTKEFRTIAFAPPLPSPLETARRQAELFGDGDGGAGAYRIGPGLDLLGLDLSACEIIDDSDVRVRLRDEPLWEAADPLGEFVPCRPVWDVSANKSLAAAAPMAVAVNGRIAATGYARLEAKGQTEFAALFPPSALRAGPNRVEAFRIQGADSATTASRPILLRPRADSSEPYRLLEGPGEAILGPGGKRIAIRPGQYIGAIEEARTQGNSIVIRGWAIDRGAEATPKAIAAFVHGRCAWIETPDGLREDIAALYGPWSARSGFEIRAPAALFRGAEAREARVFALGDDQASEISAR